MRRTVRIVLLTPEARNRRAFRGVNFGFVAQSQILEVNIVGEPTGRTHDAVKHLFLIAKRTMRRFKIDQNFAMAFLAIATIKADIHGDDDGTAPVKLSVISVTLAPGMGIY
jgi:hypothetical protein